MLKNKVRLFAIIFLIIIILSPVILATNESLELPVTTQEPIPYNDEIDDEDPDLTTSTLDKYSMDIQNGPEYLYESKINILMGMQL